MAHVNERKVYDVFMISLDLKESPLKTHALVVQTMQERLNDSYEVVFESNADGWYVVRMVRERIVTEAE